MDQSQNSLQTLIGFGKDCRGKLVGSVLLAVIGVAGGILPYYAVSRMLGLLLSGSATMASLAPWLVMAVVGFSLFVWCNALSTTLSHVSAFTILRNIRDALADKLERMPMGAILDTPSGQYKNLIVDTVEKLEKLIAHIIPELTSNLLAPVAVVVYLFVLDWRMALASLATIPVGVLCYMGMMKDYQVRYQRYYDANAHMDSTVVEYVNGIEVIKAFNQSASSYGKYTDAVLNFRDTTLEWWRGCWWYMSAALSIMPSTLLVVLPVGAWLYQGGSLPATTFLTCILLSMGIVGPLIKVMNFTDNFPMIDTTMKEISTLLNAQDLSRPAREADLGAEGFVFDHVSFAYHNDLALSDISFRTQPGQVTALVGPSGSGKSTIARLMAGLWDVTGGTVRFGGRDIREIPLGLLNRQISYVSQDNYLFNVSILDNIRMGNPDATDEQVLAAAKSANCHEFIEALEHSYDTLAGDAGGALSGGERQRVAIARAILKDAPVIILDEATAYSDPESEDRIQESLARLVKGKTMVVIAHRLSTIVNAGQIVVVENGRIESVGSHAILMDSSPVYRKLWENYTETADFDAKEGA